VRMGLESDDVAAHLAYVARRRKGVPSRQHWREQD
jgi:hypothetical protein